MIDENVYDCKDDDVVKTLVSSLEKASVYDTQEEDISVQLPLPVHEGLKNVESENPKEQLLLKIENDIEKNYEQQKNVLDLMLHDALNVMKTATRVAVESGDAKSINAVSSLYKNINSIQTEMMNLMMKYKNEVSSSLVENEIMNNDSSSSTALQTATTINNVQNTIHITTEDVMKDVKIESLMDRFYGDKEDDEDENDEDEP